MYAYMYVNCNYDGMRRVGSIAAGWQEMFHWETWGSTPTISSVDFKIVCMPSMVLHYLQWHLLILPWTTKLTITDHLELTPTGVDDAWRLWIDLWMNDHGSHFWGFDDSSMISLSCPTGCHHRTTYELDGCMLLGQNEKKIVYILVLEKFYLGRTERLF